MNAPITNAKIDRNNASFIKVASRNISHDEDERDYELERKKAYLLREKKDKEKKLLIDKEIKARSKTDQKKINDIMENFFILWFIKRNINDCKQFCEINKLYFYDKYDGNDSETFNIVSIQMYVYQMNYEREKTKMVNHKMEGNTLLYRAKKRNGTYLDGFIEFEFNSKFKIIKIEVGTFDDNHNIIVKYRQPKNNLNKVNIARLEKNTSKNTNVDIFQNIPEKQYEYKHDEIIQVSPFQIWDSDCFLEKQKGSLYALMFKLYRAWLIYYDIEDLIRLLEPEARLYDKVTGRDFFTGRDVASYLFTFVAHHELTGIYIRQYKIIDNELIIRIHNPEKSEWVDILVYARINKEKNLFTELTMKEAYFDAFQDKGDVTPEVLKQLETVFKSRYADRFRKKEDFQSAVLFKMDQNMVDLDIDTFATSDTEVYLADKLTNETPAQRVIVPIESRTEIVPSPKPPLKFIYDLKTPSFDTEELYTNPMIFKKKKHKEKPEEKKKSVLCSDDSFFWF